MKRLLTGSCQLCADCWLGVKFEDNQAKLGNPKTFGESEDGRSVCIAWHCTTPYTSPMRSIHRQCEGSQPVELYPMETIPLFVAPPWWMGPRIHIEEDSCACSTHDREIAKDRICIYTDGSSIGGHVGAAAVYLDAGQMRNTYMGTDSTSTVYAAELQGVNLALAMAKTKIGANACRKTINQSLFACL